MENEVRKNKSNNPIIIVIVILVAVLCTLVGFILGGKFSNNEKTPNTPVDDKDNNVEEQIPIVTKSQVEELVRNILNDKGMSKGAVVSIMNNNGKFDDDLKGVIAYNNIYASDDSNHVTKKSCKDLLSNNNDFVSDTTGNYIVKLQDGTEAYCTSDARVYSYDKINSEYKKIFGTDIEKTNIYYPSKDKYPSVCTYMAYYDKRLNQYIEISRGCGGTDYKYEIESYNQIENILNVNIKINIINPETNENVEYQKLKFIYEYFDGNFIFKDGEKVS